MTIFRTVALLSATLALFNYNETNGQEMVQANYYEPTWESLSQHQTPKWLKDGKFGIYTHWGIYCYSGINGKCYLELQRSLYESRKRMGQGL
nr:alpha-L-fucosidase [Allomuricauda sp.]